MNRRFHLYPHSEQEQRLGLSASLVGANRLEGFEEAIAPFEVTVTEVPKEGRVTDKRGELSIRPPLPKERIADFGNALVSFANSHGLDYHNEVLFVDHVTPTDELLKQAIERKVGQRRHLSLVIPEDRK